MKILLLCNEGRSYSINRLIEEVKKRGLESETVLYRDIYLKLDTNSLEVGCLKDINFKDYKYTIPRTPSHSEEKKFLLEFMRNQNASNKHVLNEDCLLNLGGVYNKFYQYINLAKHNIPLIPSIMPDVYIMDEKNAEKLSLRFPMVLKQIIGSLGSTVHIVNNIQEVNEFIEKYSRDKIILQKLVKADHDLRVVVLNHEVIGVMKRSSTTDFRNNYHLGAQVENIEISNEVREIALKCTKALKMDLAGIDLIKDGDEYKVLEVNLFLQYKGFEECTGINLAGKIVDFALSFDNK